jgi:hypothetical protein
VRKPEEYFSDIEDIKMLKLAEHIVERSVVPSMPLPHGSKAMTRSRLTHQKKSRKSACQLHGLRGCIRPPRSRSELCAIPGP